MKTFEKTAAPGISIKVALGLMLIVFVAFVSGGVAKHYFNKSAVLFQAISRERLPLLIAASKLAKEAEGMISDGSALILAENALILESLSRSIAMDLKKIRGLILQLNAAHVTEAPDLSKSARRIYENLKSLERLMKGKIEMDLRILQLSILMRHTWESLILGEKPEQAASTRTIRGLFVQIFSLLRDVPNISDSQRLEEYQSQILELKKRIDRRLEDGYFKTAPLMSYAHTLEIYALGEKGLLALSKARLKEERRIRDRLLQNSFLSGELARKTNLVFADISGDIQRQSRKATQEIEWIGRLILLIPIVIIVSAVLIFLFIRRSVTGRILGLEQVMKAHVQGNPLPIPIEGQDEIASMAKSVAYFVQKRDEDEANLWDARQAAEKANRAKSIFLAHMSHELRTPLNAILGFSQLLTRNKTLPSHDMEYLATIRQSGEHLLTLINQILDLSAIEAGRVTLKESDFDLHALVNEVESMFRIQAMDKRLGFVLERGERVPRFIRSDPLKLRQVLLNLLNNAFKFTEKGRITLRINILQHNDEPLETEGESFGLRFEVEDTGNGIDPEALTKIFDAFEQTDSGRMATEGTGLGLTISQRFVELMGGRISVESGVGAGALFRFDIYVRTAQARGVETLPPLGRAVAPAPTSVGREDWQELFRTLPAPLREKLQGALLRADMETVNQLVEQIAAREPRLAAKLREWANDFQYETIMSFMKED